MAIQSVCGVSVVKDYYKYSKFNVLEIANKFNAKTIEGAPLNAKKADQDKVEEKVETKAEKSEERPVEKTVEDESGLKLL